MFGGPYKYTTYHTALLDISLSKCNKRRLTASDCPEGNRRDYSMSGNQTSGKEGGVQYVLTVVCMYVCVCVCMLDIVYV